IAKAKAAIQRFKPRHLADLLAALQLPVATSRQWARGDWRRNEFGERILTVKPKQGWAAATASVPRPKNHDLHMLRYLSHPTLDLITARRGELEADGAGEIDALRQAVDEIVGEARKAGEARRAARRIAKYGHDPVPEKRLTQEERDAQGAEIKKRRAPYLAKNKHVLRRRTPGSVGTTARLRRAKRAKLKAFGGRKGLAVAMLEAKRKARWQKTAAELYGVKSFKHVPKKPLHELEDEGTARRIERALAGKPVRKREPVVMTIDYSQGAGHSTYDHED
ncbi:MAG: hypothetical protein AB7O71_17210, partial [Hyphomicrobiaceae bacterium]